MSLEKIAEVISRLDNLEASLGMGIPAQTHVDCMRSILPQIRDELKTAYLEMGGEDYWANT